MLLSLCDAFKLRSNKIRLVPVTKTAHIRGVVFLVSDLIVWFWNRTVISSKLSYLVTKTYFLISGSSYLSDRTSLVRKLLVRQSQQPVWNDRTWVMPNTAWRSRSITPHPRYRKSISITESHVSIYISVAVRYKKTISIIETVISIDYWYTSTSWHLILAIVHVVYRN